MRSPAHETATSLSTTGAGKLTRAKQHRNNTRTTAGHLDGALGRMPAIWRPNVSEVLPDEDVEVGVTEDASSKGTKRKRAPPRRDRARGEVSVELQGVQRLSARSSALSVQGVRGGQSASTVVSALCARGAVGLKSASTVVSALGARSAVGLNLRARSYMLYMQGVRWVSNLRARSSALSVQGVRCINLRARSCRSLVHQSASTVARSHCKECGGV